MSVDSKPSKRRLSPEAMTARSAVVRHAAWAAYGRDQSPSCEDLARTTGLSLWAVQSARREMVGLGIWPPFVPRAVDRRGRVRAERAERRERIARGECEEDGPEDDGGSPDPAPPTLEEIAAMKAAIRAEWMARSVAGGPRCGEDDAHPRWRKYRPRVAVDWSGGGGGYRRVGRHVSGAEDLEPGEER